MSLTRKEKEAIINHADKWDGNDYYGSLDGRR